MPVIDIHSPLAVPPDGLLDAVVTAAAGALGLPEEHAWAMWHPIDRQLAARPEWDDGGVAPVVSVRCKATHPAAGVHDLMLAVQKALADGIGCPADEVYLTVQPVEPHLLLVRGQIGDGHNEADQKEDDVR